MIKIGVERMALSLSPYSYPMAFGLTLTLHPPMMAVETEVKQHLERKGAPSTSSKSMVQIPSMYAVVDTQIRDSGSVLVNYKLGTLLGSLSQQLQTRLPSSLDTSH